MAFPLRVFAATSNAGKLREFALAAAAYPELEIGPLPGFREIIPAEETGLTFEDNARLKALHYGAHTGDLVFAEDSGLEVAALGGAPGVYSARFAGEGATDAANNALLLERLAGIGDRSARFVCVIALARRGEVLATFEGFVEGFIAETPQGDHGFGYDPLFFHPPSGCTTAQLSPEAKLAISHRGAAFRQMLAWLHHHAPSLDDRA
jgi:XTP/dITP diphosphohydrolase